MLYRHLRKQFGGGPDIVRWATVTGGCATSELALTSHEKTEHVSVVCTTTLGSQTGTATEATLYLPLAVMRICDFEKAAKEALGLQSEQDVVATDGEEVTYSSSPDATLFLLGYMVCPPPPPPPALFLTSVSIASRLACSAP